MKLKLTFPLSLLVFIICSFSYKAADLPELKNLYDKQKYFELREELAKTSSKSSEMLFYKGIVYAKFNVLDSSIACLKNYIEKSSDTELLAEAYSVMADCYAKSYKYAEAGKAYDYWLANYKETADSAEYDNTVNAAKLWKACSSVPAQKIIQNSDVDLKITRDIAGLMNLPVVAGKDTVNFVFDTGANVSTITKSYAKRLNLIMMDDSLQVGAITGNKVYMRPAYAPHLNLGGADVENAVFIVVDDAALSFPQANYYIHGIIGFPIIEAFDEFTIFKNDSMHIPAAKGKHKVNNMVLENLTPIVCAQAEGKNLYFSFDTGAKETLLYKSYYDDFEDEIQANSRFEEVNMGGAGGAIKVNVYQFPNFKASIGGQDVTLSEVSILPENLIDSAENLYGNLGQDVIGQFNSMTLNFLSMSLIFE